ncbi:MAG: peptidoglycan DD-metalloendopeptidase family protein [Pseudomonadota bacterium]
MRHETVSHPTSLGRARLTLLASTAALSLAACADQPLDFDLRGLGGGFSTADAATAPAAERPRPDDRGVISYPNYQVAVAERGDTVNDVATRLGVDATSLARYNGLTTDVPLRRGEIIALPNRLAQTPSGPGSGQPVDIGALAGNAIDRSPATPGVQTAALAPAAPAPVATAEPVRHQVERGETAYTISRLYGVSVKDLAEWNALGADFDLREGQFLLIPVAKRTAPVSAPAQNENTTAPGTGSPTPTPPSAVKPLPKDVAAQSGAEETPSQPIADVGPTTKPVRQGKMITPVTGTIIREYAKGRNEGIDIKAAPGTAVKAADAGTVAAITKSAEGVPIIVVRHPDNLLTVYANVADVQVEKGTAVSKGQSIAKLRDGDDAYVHFEVRQGFDSVDPAPYLN